MARLSTKKRAARTDAPARHEVSRIYGAEAPKLEALLEKDRGRSLQRRWRFIQKKYPSLVEQLGYIPLLGDPGWAVVAIPEDRVVYTLGLHYTWNHPELLIQSPAAANARGIVGLKKLLNGIAAQVASLGMVVEPGHPIRDGRKRLTFKPFTDADFAERPCGYIARFDELFLDTFHTRGGTLPVLWASMR